MTPLVKKLLREPLALGLRADGPGQLFLPGVAFVVLGVLGATDLRMRPNGVTARPAC